VESIKSDIKHEGILAFGCGCNKAKSAGSPVNRSTVYQVLAADQSIAGEFASLQEARNLAVSISGRVKVSSVAKT
jgi:hypothetical protein